MNILKGDNFRNRYRFKGLLTALSPLHIGTGEDIEESILKGNIEATVDERKEVKDVKVSLIATDHKDKPYIPGSALRGVLRHYLRNIFTDCGNERLIKEQVFESDEFKNKTQIEKINYMRDDASIWECVFGTPFAEGKVEFWDAPTINPTANNQFASRGWLADRNTYLVKSVAIDPETGTADPHKLYTFEVAPTGLCFEVNVVGQNVSNEELGMLIFALESFNSDILPVTIGGMAGRGFGRMKFELAEIHCLNENDLNDWIKNSRDRERAGYYSLKDVTDQKKQLIAHFKEKFFNNLGGANA